MPIRVALAAVTLIAGIASAMAFEPVAKGMHGHMATVSYGCPMPGFVKMVLKKADTDVLAAGELGHRLGCSTIKEDTAVFVEDESKVGVGYVCLKIEGRDKCTWTVNDHILPD